jgi:hypothetical protein
MNWWRILIMVVVAGVVGNIVARLRMRSPEWKQSVDWGLFAVLAAGLVWIALEGTAALWVVVTTVLVGLMVAVIFWSRNRKRRVG